MPSIGVRIGQAGGGDFSGLYGSMGRGLATGIQQGLQYGQQVGEMQREQKARDFFAGEFERLGGPPEQMDAFRALDPRLQAAEVERLRSERLTARKLKSFGEKMESLLQHPLTQESAQSLLERAQFEKDPMKLMDEADELSKGLRMYREGISQAQAMTQRWMRVFQAEIEGGMPANARRNELMEAVVGRIQRAEQNPALEFAINDDDTDRWESEWRKAALTAEDEEDIREDERRNIYEEERRASLAFGDPHELAGQQYDPMAGMPRPDDSRRAETAQALQAGPMREKAVSKGGMPESAENEELVGRKAAQEQGGMPALNPLEERDAEGRVTRSRIPIKAKVERIAVPWKGPASEEGKPRSFQDVQQNGEVYARMMDDLLKVWKERGPQGVKEVAEAAGIDVSTKESGVALETAIRRWSTKYPEGFAGSQPWMEGYKTPKPWEAKK